MEGFVKRIINKLGISKSYPLEVNGTQYKVPVHKGLGFNHFSDAEPWMTEVLRRLGSDYSHFLDVGVNIGQTLLKWKSLYPTKTYVGFEPNTHCVDYVNRLIQKNELKQCTLHPFGIAGQAMETNLYLLGRDKGDSSATLIENLRENESRNVLKIRTAPLHEIDPSPFDLIKIDVEGAELEVLDSIFGHIKNATYICEILPVYSKENIERLYRQELIEKLLHHNDYSIWRILKNKSVSLQPMESFDIHSDLSKSDYIFAPTNKASAIIDRFS